MPFTTLAGLAGMAVITAGEFRPLYLDESSLIVKVAAFHIDQKPVTNQDYFDFVKHYPKWQKEKIPSLFADIKYLDHWVSSDQTNSKPTEPTNATVPWQPSQAILDGAVINVSWFAASAYCQSKGKQLPSVSQWEYVAKANKTRPNGSDDPKYRQTILDWYGQHHSQSNTPVASNPANYWGVYDMHGLNWEWTEDFNSALVSGESRADSSIDQKLFCAAGTVGSADPSDYAAFMRYGFRSSLKANYSLPNLGFRCISN